MRVFFSADDYQFEPDTHFYDFVKTKSHQVESGVPTPQLPHFWANEEADVHAKHGAYGPRSSALHYAL